MRPTWHCDVIGLVEERNDSDSGSLFQARFFNLNKSLRHVIVLPRRVEGSRGWRSSERHISRILLLTMQTGKKGKRKAATAQLHVHEEYASTRIQSTSLDDRRVHFATATFGTAAEDRQVAPESSEDLRTLQAIDDVENFSYLLGDDLPFQPEEDPSNGDSDGIRVTLKAKRNDRSVSNAVYCLHAVLIDL